MTATTDPARLLDEVISDPGRPVSPEEADILFTEYPCFVYPQARAFADATGADRELLCRRIAMNVGDPIALRALLGVDPEEFASFYPDMTPVSLSTEDTIDTFLDHFGKKPDNAGDSGPVIPVAPAIDYASAFMEEGEEETENGENSASDTTSSAIDAFLKAVPAPAPEAPKKHTVENQNIAQPAISAKKEPETPALTESLARVMIKNRNYRKALEIIMELNLKNPEKSIYFADQIRFLRKLIINESKS